MSKWIEGKLRDLVEVNPTVKLIKGEIYPFVSMDVIQPFYKPVEAKEEREFKSGGAKFENGDTLFARITPCLENGKIAQVKNLKNGKGFGSTEFIVLRGKEGITDTDFVYYLVTNKSFRENAERLMVGTSGRQRVDKQQFEDQIISIPDLETQKRISSILGGIDKKIELNVEMNKTLEEMAMTLYKHWFVDFGPFQDGEFAESELGVIPKGWKAKKLGDLYDTSSGGTPSRRKTEYYQDGTINWLKTKELNDNFIFETEEKITELGLENSSAKVFPKNTVIIAMYGATVGKLGILSEPSSTNQACCAVIEKNQSFSYVLAYLYLLFNRTKIVGLANGGAQQNINQQIIRDLPIIVPTEKALNIIQPKLLELFELIRTNEQENRYLINLRDYLLPRLLSGEIDVSQAEKQVEEVL
ncbi:restriction endonuclease subunit S [Geobacillus sp. 46C-IIa]|uniref:restriction endonuclease subunit S n=1 Tax=Geobacillus sp. 46C-IIa TaxID=1963025 RepID=UPI0009C11102|nr:restriction endonuclease subunit S [Geobacillus sp. 46C-IIa]OQP08142.1 restriction endonuclease subunit S [Geobacillus sp. 46C-IIa]QNU26698.1 restriction endonuclease subunit S [Geobacillus sp. 46C-IIa]